MVFNFFGLLISIIYRSRFVVEGRRAVRCPRRSRRHSLEILFAALKQKFDGTPKRLKNPAPIFLLGQRLKASDFLKQDSARLLSILRETKANSFAAPFDTSVFR